MTCILRRKVDELPAGSSLRDVDLRAIQGLLDHFPLVELDRHEQLPRAFLSNAIRADQKRLQHVGILFFIDILEELVIAREQLPGTNAQPGYARIGPISRVSQHIAVAALDLHDHGRLLQSLEMLENVSQLRRSLEIEGLRGKLDPLL